MPRGACHSEFTYFGVSFANNGDGEIPSRKVYVSFMQTVALEDVPLQLMQQHS